MTAWTSDDRFRALLAGEPADRPAVAAWGHFVPEEQDPAALARAHVEFARRFDWDWVKVNPRNTHYAEAWGNQYDYSDYTGAQPAQIAGAVREPADLWSIEHLPIRRTLPLIEHIDLLRLIRAELPGVPLVQTVFSPLTVLLTIVGQSRHVGARIKGGRDDLTVGRLSAENRAGVHRALHAIALTLADYVAGLAMAGASGIFYALTSTPNDSLFSEPEFNEYSRPYDAVVLDAARSSGVRTILHTCGTGSHPERFVGYGVDALSWDHFAPRNADVDDIAGVLPVGGVDRQAVRARDVETVRAQSRAFIESRSGRPALLAPTCGVPTDLDNPALLALREAVERVPARAV